MEKIGAFVLKYGEEVCDEIEKIYYEKYPEENTDDSEDGFKNFLTKALEVVTNGNYYEAAADILKKMNDTLDKVTEIMDEYEQNHQ